MTERFENTTDFTLLAHHLSAWGSLAERYLKRFNGIKPWELSSGQKPLLIKFAEDLAYNELDSDLDAMNYFEGDSSDEYFRDRAKYFHDLIGNTEDDFVKVEQLRKELYIKFLELAQTGKDVPIRLITEGQDGYCNTCAIGEHCKVSGKDTFFKDSLMDFIARGEVTGISLGSNDKDLYITTHLLFNLDFYQTLWKDLEKRGIKEWV